MRISRRPATRPRCTFSLEQYILRILNSHFTLEHRYVDYAELANELKVDQIVFIDDGLITLKVLELNPEKGEILCEAINSGVLVRNYA